MDLIASSHIDTGDGGAYGPQRAMTSYGLGWSLYSYRGHKMVEHGGNINGFTSSTALVPDLNLGVFVSANMNVTLLAVRPRAADRGHGPGRDGRQLVRAAEGV